MKFKLFLSFPVLVGSLACSQPFEIMRDIPYADPPVSEKQKLDLYIPQIDRPMPCLVWIHGGAWQAGSKDRLVPEIDTLLYHGFVVASIGYRLSGEAIFPAQIRDCKEAVRFLKGHAPEYRIDSSRIAVAGSSAGGHLAALLGTSAGVPAFDDQPPGAPGISARVRAVIDFYGPTDFLIMDELPVICRDPVLHLNPDSPESRLLGCNIADCPEKAGTANPITYISADDPPFLIFHGTSDCTVTPKSSMLLEERLQEAGVAAELHLIPGTGHGGEEFSTPEVKTKVLEFMKKIMQ